MPSMQVSLESINSPFSIFSSKPDTSLPTNSPPSFGISGASTPFPVAFEQTLSFYSKSLPLPPTPVWACCSGTWEHSSILSPSSFELYRTTAADSACCTRSKQSRRLYFTAVDFAVLYTHLNDSHRRHRRRRVDPPSPNPSNPLQYCTRSY